MTRPAAGFPRLRRGRDAGFTIIELVVTIALFSIFMSLFIGVVVSLYRSSTWVESTSRSSSGVLVAFQNLDRQVRYADSVNFPGEGASGARYIEFRTPATSLATADVCTQWRLHPDGRLQFRQWNKGDAASVSPWVTKMNIVIQESDPNYPFRLVPARTDGSAKQQVVLTIEAGSESEDSGTRTSTTFVARNSSIASPSNVDSVTAGVSDTKVCTITGWEMRP